MSPEENKKFDAQWTPLRSAIFNKFNELANPPRSTFELVDMLASGQKVLDLRELPDADTQLVVERLPAIVDILKQNGADSLSDIVVNASIGADHAVVAAMVTLCARLGISVKHVQDSSVMTALQKPPVANEGGDNWARVPPYEGSNVWALGLDDHPPLYTPPSPRRLSEDGKVSPEAIEQIAALARISNLHYVDQEVVVHAIASGGNAARQEPITEVRPQANTLSQPGSVSRQAAVPAGIPNPRQGVAPLTPTTARPHDTPPAKSWQLAVRRGDGKLAMQEIASLRAAEIQSHTGSSLFARQRETPVLTFMSGSSKPQWAAGVILDVLEESYCPVRAKAVLDSAGVSLVDLFKALSKLEGSQKNLTKWRATMPAWDNAHQMPRDQMGQIIDRLLNLRASIKGDIDFNLKELSRIVRATPSQ